MAIGAIASAAAGAFATAAPGLLQSGLNRRFQRQQNEKDRAFQRDNMHTQRGWAVEDRDYQNKYNSPEAQMQRLRDAGINPRMAIGGSASFEPSATTRGASPEGGNQPAPQVDLSSLGNIVPQMLAIMKFQTDVAKTNAETDNIKAATELTKEQSLKLPIERQNLITATDKIKWETERSKSLFPIDMAAAKANVQRTEVETQYVLDKNQREQVMNTLQGNKVTAETYEIYKKIALMNLEQELKKAEVSMIGMEKEKRMRDLKLQQQQWLNADMEMYLKQTENTMLKALQQAEINHMDKDEMTQMLMGILAGSILKSK